MLAAPLLYCTNVLFTLFGVYSFATFFHIYNDICPPLFKLTYALLMIWLLAHPSCQQDMYLSLLTVKGGWVNLLNNGAANKNNIFKSEVLLTVSSIFLGRPSLNNWASVSEKGNRFNKRWRLNTETNGHRLPRSEANIYHLPPSFFLITHDL